MARGWRRLLFPGIFLVYLAQTAGGVSTHSHGAAAAAGYALIPAFCVVYLATLQAAWTDVIGARYWVLVAGLTSIYAIENLFAHQDAYVMAIFVCVLIVRGLPRWRWVPVLALTVIAAYLPRLVSSWHAGVSYGALFAIPMVSFAMFGFFMIIRSNQELSEARSEVARLAAENERSRIARDLHDVLGHSLTTITVKAGLAHRLAERDPIRAAAEIAEVERLARSALADVRATIGGYREVTLAGELATGREVLRAAGITPTLPSGVDTARPEHHELFGWVVREGLTNVVRHARATTCTVTLGSDRVEIVDNGIGQPSAGGNGLRGLTERVEAAGGTVEAGPIRAGGWRLRVEVPPPHHDGSNEPAAEDAPAVGVHPATAPVAERTPSGSPILGSLGPTVAPR